MVFVLFLLSVAGLGLMGCWGIIIYYPTFITPVSPLISDWPTATILARDWPALTQSSPCRRHDCLVEWTRATWGQGSSHRHIDNILTFFINFSCLVSTRHLARSLSRAPSLTRSKLSHTFPMIHSFNKSIEWVLQLYKFATQTSRCERICEILNIYQLPNLIQQQGKWVS